MALLENLPKALEKTEFDGFLEQVKRDYSANEFPELFIHYQQVEDKIWILGIGENSECAQQALRAYQENPELKKRRSATRILRAPKTGFWLR